MGSGTSRGKKVAPASCVSEIDVPKRDGGTYSQKLESHSFRSLKIPNFATNNARARAQMDCHSEGHDSESSAEDDDTVVESDRVLTIYEDPHEDFAKRKNSPKKSYIRSKTYGLCNFRRVHVDGDLSSTPHFLPTTALCEEPRGPDIDVNKKSNGLFSKKHTPPFQNGSLTKGPCCVESLPRSEKHSSLHNSLTMPVLFDGSEEELMDTIEREFS